MKRIFKYIILLVICFIPFSSDAKIKPKLDWRADDLVFLYEENDIYYLMDYTIDMYNDVVKNMENIMLYAYDIDGNLLGEEIIYDKSKYTPEEFSKTKRFQACMDLYYLEAEGVYDSTNNVYYDITYDNLHFSYYDFETNQVIDDSFYSDNEFIRNLLGEKTQVLEYFYNTINDGSILEIMCFDEVNLVFYEDNNYYGDFLLVFDKDMNKLFEVKVQHEFVNKATVKDGFLYLNNQYDKIYVYDLEGNLHDTINISGNNFEYLGDTCNSYDITGFRIKDNDLLVSYSIFMCLRRVNVSDVNELVREEMFREEFVLKYTLSHDIKKINSNNGEFTYKELEDEDGKNYVELKISPKDGYIVDEIIVTDSKGNKIEVTDNKFYMPDSDVKIEVKYKTLEEYVAVPDTFLGRSITLIFIGFILIGLGVYTVNYVKN